MPDRELHEEPEREIVHEETERSDADVHEHHVVREETSGPEVVHERDVVREEVVRPEREVVRERVTRPAASSRFSGVQKDREEVLDTHENRWNYNARVISVLGIWVGVMLAVVEVFLALRLLFGLTAANPAAGFVSFIYGSTGWMVAPFQGIGPNGAIIGGGVFEPGTLVAMIVYPLFALLVILLLRAIAAYPKPDDSYVRHSSRRRTL